MKDKKADSIYVGELKCTNVYNMAQYVNEFQNIGFVTPYTVIKLDYW